MDTIDKQQQQCQSWHLDHYGELEYHSLSAEQHL